MRKFMNYTMMDIVSHHNTEQYWKQYILLNPDKTSLLWIYNMLYEDMFYVSL